MFITTSSRVDLRQFTVNLVLILRKKRYFKSLGFKKGTKRPINLIIDALNRRSSRYLRHINVREDGYLESVFFSRQSRPYLEVSHFQVGFRAHRVNLGECGFASKLWRSKPNE